MAAQRYPVRLAGIILAAVVLAGCGWQLRGAAGGGLEGVPIALEGGVGNRLLERVGAELRSLGAERVSAAGAARHVLSVEDAERRRRTVATDARGFAVEYELSYRLRFRIRPGGLAEPEVVTGPVQTVRTRVDYPVDPDNLQAAQAEEDALVEDLQNDAIRLMLARLARSR